MLWIPCDKCVQGLLDIARNKLLLLLAVYTVSTSLDTHWSQTDIPCTAMEYTSHCMVTPLHVYCSVWYTCTVRL